MEPTLGVVVLTMGDRPAELAALLASVAAQDGAQHGVRTVLLGQGTALPPLPDWVDAVELPENLGFYVRPSGDESVPEHIGRVKGSRAADLAPRHPWPRHRLPSTTMT
ncbi:hypothetical protein [Kitasatospora sp. YST-16]|uniref:hypothetical protein n=1 Tax=Kitasatospora sp. YST-16 TaxID=2998080 RepID=UPI003FA371D3